MKDALVGYTGFVGSNLAKEHDFEGLYNSKNIKDAYGTCPELLIYAGIRAEKYIANKFPEKDKESVIEALENIKKINPKKLVLISTIDVYSKPIDVNEEDKIFEDNQAYGANRRWLEVNVRKSFPDALIVRLPALFGCNLKKNYIYDFIHRIPKLLNEKKYLELTERCLELKNYYDMDSNGFYSCKSLGSDEKDKLLNIFKTLDFDALQFTDTQATFQFYNLKYLYSHIQIAMAAGIKYLNLAVEPIKVDELYRYLTNEKSKQNILSSNPPLYNFKTKYSEIFGGKNGYIFSREAILSDIKSFVEGEINK